MRYGLYSQQFRSVHISHAINQHPDQQQQLVVLPTISLQKMAIMTN